MDKYLIIVNILCFSIKTVLTDANLQQQNANQDQLNPINDYESADNSVKDQDKRTIFNPTVANYGWAKHVGFHPSGFKYVLGFSPVDLKYSPVIRPISVKHHGYAYGRPRLHLHVKKPVIHIKAPKPLYHAGWKSARPIARPVNIPLPHPHIVTKPVAISKPVHSDHLHTHVDHVHVKPGQHVDHVHQLPLPHIDHVHENPIHSVAVQHADHIHSVVQPHPVQHVHFQPIHQVPVQSVAVPPPLPPPQPVVTVSAPAPFVPSPIFEVTKPNLGVLPLGAVFPSPVLQSIPPAPPAFPIPLKPALIPQQVAPAAIPLPQPAPLPRPTIIPHPVSPQSIYPPGTFVEYHGNTNFINLLKQQIPVLPQNPVNEVQSGLPHHYHFQYPQIPQNIHTEPQAHSLSNQHDVQTPFVPANPQIFQGNQLQFQQQLPVDSPTSFHSTDQINSHNIYQQQLPINSQSQFQTEQDNQNFFQQQLPQDGTPHFQPADQVSTQHFFHQSMDSQQDQFQPVNQNENENSGYVYQQPDISNLRQSIQPGQTDIQLPLHLPQHPGFVQSSRQFQPDNIQDPQYSESVFRPSIQLEPPYKK